MENLNLEFSGNILRALRINESREIILKEEIDLSFNVNDEVSSKKNKPALIEEFEECISEINKTGDSEKITAGILIGTQQTFLNVTPIDFSEDSNAISSHILWELSNYYPETYKDFNIQYYRLNNNYLSGNIDDALLIAVNKPKLEFIKSLCDGAGISIKNVEIDHFAVEKCLKYISVDLKNTTLLVAGFKDDRMDFSLIVNGRLRNYSFEITERGNYKNQLINQIGIFNSGLHRIDSIYLYGSEKISGVKDFLNEQFLDLPVSFIQCSDNAADNKFTPLYGLALKNAGKN